MKPPLILLLLCLPLLMCSSSSNSGAENNTIQDTKELSNYATACFASGCFWCVEAIYESVDGVVEAVSGYAGGTEKNPSYRDVSAGKTSHAESVLVYYDPEKVNFRTLVRVYYGSQDPTTVDGQHPDYGRQYRSIIFYASAEEKQIAEEEKAKLEDSNLYDAPIATEILPFDTFWEAEEYHQNYERLHPEQPYVRSVSVPRLNRFKAKFPELLKKEE